MTNTTPPDWQDFATRLVQFISKAPVSSGVCCCGDLLDSHGPASDHMVCDRWSWEVEKIEEKYEKMLAAAPEPPKGE